MAAPNMDTITASLEQSLQNCSLNHHRSSGSSASVAETSVSRSSTSDNTHLPGSETTLELNSHLSLPYHWEQCLDLKTGEIYYINWRNGIRVKEDPRINRENSEDLYSEEDGSYEYDSEESSSESYPSSSTRSSCCNGGNKNQVLVVAGCKSCFMYFMVPKQVEKCLKCGGQLLHFDRSGSAFP